VETNIRPQVGEVIAYDDGRDGYKGARAVVVGADEFGMVVQFDDRADTTPQTSLCLASNGRMSNLHIAFQYE
jgi:hypothetical protein